MMNDRIEKLLDDIRHLSEDHYVIARQLRELVLAAGAGVTEQVKYGGILFSSGVPFCGVFSYANHVSLELSEGAKLPDPHQVLEGGGKLRRHIKLRAATDIAGKHVREYIESAFAAVGSG